MKIILSSLMLSCAAASSATSGDSMEMLRDRLVFCNQFIIEDPFPAIAADPTRYCCRFANRVHDCHVNDWDEKYR